MDHLIRLVWSYYRGIHRAHVSSGSLSDAWQPRASLLGLVHPWRVVGTYQAAEPHVEVIPFREPSTPRWWSQSDGCHLCRALHRGPV